jgi:tetratricopeptide (TPR) repeat protein
MKITHVFHTILILFLLLPNFSNAQKCRTADCFMQLGKDLYQQTDYQEAYKNFRQAQKIDDSKIKEADKWIIKIFESLDNYRVEAQKSENEVKKMKDSLKTVIADKGQAVGTIEKYVTQNKVLEKKNDDLAKLNNESDSLNNVLRNDIIAVETTKERLNRALQIEKIRTEELEATLKKRKNTTQAVVKSSIFLILIATLYFIQ